MIAHTATRNACLMALSLGLFSTSDVVMAGHPAQGLWVGEVALNEVNEATGAVGDSNTFEFTDPELTTATSDTAFLRLIVHVNGAGQANLLKSVAVIETDESPLGGSQILLITDPNLYHQFPGIAKRIASAAYDFGDQQAVTAVQSLMDRATESAVSRVIADAGGDAVALENTVLLDLVGVVSGADVNSAYLDRGTGASSFLTSNSFFDVSEVETIANEVARLIDADEKSVEDFALDLDAGTYAPFSVDPLVGGFGTAVAAAETLRDASFFNDTRGLEAIAGIVIAAAQATANVGEGQDLNEKQEVAAAAAIDAWHNAADLDQQYNRFLSGAEFNAMRAVIPAVAATQALDSAERDLNQEEIENAVIDALLLNSTISDALVEAVSIKSASLWGDPRAENTINQILNRVAATVAAQAIESDDPAELLTVAEESTTETFASAVPAPVFAGAPSGDYNDFVRGASYQDAAGTAARSAAREAVFQYNAGITREAELTFLTQRAVNRDLASIRNVAAALPQNEIPLHGSFSPGGAISGVIHLPALAPTNPFMHRRHPDHTEGVAITRHIALSFDVTDDGEFARAGYGVSRITGTYFEELFGLHKPLGNNQDIGLRTRGSFNLNRLTLTNTLNF